MIEKNVEIVCFSLKLNKILILKWKIFNIATGRMPEGTTELLVQILLIKLNQMNVLTTTKNCTVYI